MNETLKPYFLASQESDNIQIKARSDDWFSFINMSDQCEVTVYFEHPSQCIVMVQVYTDGNTDDDDISLKGFIDYIS